MYKMNFVTATIGVTSIPCNRYRLKNGRVRMKSTSKLVRFVCDRGYMIIGSKFGDCVKGYFEQAPPVCVNKRPNCKKINGLNNGLIIPEQNNVVVHFFCKPEFNLIGPNVTICDGNKWIHGLPTCLPNNTTEPQTNCNFEEDDICGWSHDLNHDFDWKRTNLETPTRETGPRFDHTNGPLKNGHYMYVESTSRLENDTSRLISPIFAKKPVICVRFYFHMYGKDMGTLNVYVKHLNEDFQKLRPFFSVSGNQGDSWNLGQFPAATTEQFQVIFEGIRGKSYFSDIAIDDVSIIDDVCPEEPPQTTEFSSYSTEPEEIPIYDSCFNRCGQNDSTTCSCDDNCYELNLCCADYIQYCFLGSSIDYEDINEISTTEPTELTESDATTESVIVEEISSAPTTTTKQPIKITAKPTEKTQFIRITLPQIIMPKKPKFFTKLLTTSTTTITSTARTTIFQNVVEQTASPVIEIETDFVVTTRQPDVQYLQQNTKKSVGNTNNLVVYMGIVGSVVFVTFVVVTAVIVLKRNNFNCKTFQNSRNNDSMSDVRFLASDEVLDFTWKRAEDL